MPSSKVSHIRTRLCRSSTTNQPYSKVSSYCSHSQNTSAIPTTSNHPRWFSIRSSGFVSARPLAQTHRAHALQTGTKIGSRFSAGCSPHGICPGTNGMSDIAHQTYGQRETALHNIFGTHRVATPALQHSKSHRCGNKGLLELRRDGGSTCAPPGARVMSARESSFRWMSSSLA